MLIRDAVPADLPEILTVHNAAIADTTAIWDEEQVGLADRQAWFDQRTGAALPILTAEIDGRVAGYASYGPFRPKSGYRHTVENSVYVADGFHRRGVATALMAELIERARRGDVHAIVAGIESSNTTSIALHAKFGFTVVGVMPQVGVKFGRWLDLTWMQLLIEA
ncbi:N-acetyltransferase family protein [Rhodococcus sp. BP-149]|uniref:GNAT family N-acetyltransferase n=1 Tax=unclassified Rhodococcus (in: high G+C Gram-positive bacteria) TaxID=192944 RepID=UPI001C9ADA71|nr:MULTISPECIES: GNAT family N-acetyltransferase [unclassified Rhodococcus (in: high G+C Gram-positive bacteria)]MBY6684967.1 N-acetyltransferase family protein [Rhodococcus sp. BP-288]MBY6692549.1 N-acetyltransferase family protein [Rhodococcus sp. BP-188]MBY6698447.1 N-acetyltransferase family protein [Rhodococcus sp. BP-285]MBY6701126.1 N-acetyltransferase family protein [Rhodococcus sp. BP-283]MBY6705867.1 N-acetyltransferase family protein [Rhodococcus sp. BP-241]